MENQSGEKKRSDSYEFNQGLVIVIRNRLGLTKTELILEDITVFHNFLVAKGISKNLFNHDIRVYYSEKQLNTMTMFIYLLLVEEYSMEGAYKALILRNRIKHKNILNFDITVWRTREQFLKLSTDRRKKP